METLPGVGERCREERGIRQGLPQVGTVSERLYCAGQETEPGEPCLTYSAARGQPGWQR